MLSGTLVIIKFGLSTDYPTGACIKMKSWILAGLSTSLVALLGAVPCTLVANDTDPTTEELVLNRYLGEWRIVSRLPKTERNAAHVVDSATIVYRRILAGKFVQANEERDDMESHMMLYAYDEESSTYELWFFSSTGYTSKRIGKWNPDSKALVWTNGPDTNGHIETDTHRFTGKDSFTSEVTLKNKDGEIFFRLRREAVRTAQPK